MYLDYFGLAEKPFNNTPNPRFLFLSRSHREAFAHLLYGLEQRCGFIELTGEVGTGKTTVLRSLLAELDQETCRLALIFNPSLTALDLLRGICQEYGLAGDGGQTELLGRINDFLLRENAAGRRVVLVIDEAQNLEPAVLEQIRLLSNLETETDKLIQIVLCGQPELGELLGRRQLRQLSQRITVRYHLGPMDREDTAGYIEHRLQLAGGRPEKVRFTPAAVRKIHRFSAGLPRLINILCDRCLLVAFAADRRRVSAPLVTGAIREVRRRETRLRGRSTWWVALVPAILLGLYLLLAESLRVPKFFTAAPAGPDISIPAAGSPPGELVPPRIVEEGNR